MSGDAHISETVSAGQLRAFIERIERVEEEIRTLNADKSDIYKELRGCGFDVKAVRQCVAARKLDSAEREERTAIFDMYWEALTGASRVHVHEARETTTPKASNSKASCIENGDLTTAPSELTDTQEQPETPANETHERPSINAEAYPEAGPQAEASPAGIGTGTLAGHEGCSEGEAASADLPTISNPQPAASLGAVKAPEAGNSSPASGAPFNNPRCEHPGTCIHAHDRVGSCDDCFFDWAKRPLDEQRRLWAEAMEAAESEVAA